MISALGFPSSPRTSQRITSRISRRTHLGLFHVSEVKDILHRCARQDNELALATPSCDCFRVPVRVDTCSKSTMPQLVKFCSIESLVTACKPPTIQRPLISESRSSNISGAPNPKASKEAPPKALLRDLSVAQCEMQEFRKE